MLQLGQTPLTKVIRDSIYLASQCVRYEGPLSGTEILSLPRMQTTIWRALADMWLMLPDCRCPLPMETCSCEYYARPETLEKRWPKVVKHIQWTQTFREELLGLEGAQCRPVAATEEEEDEALSGDVPEGVLEDLMMANLREK